MPDQQANLSTANPTGTPGSNPNPQKPVAPKGFVPEADLLAVKKGSETVVAKLKAELAKTSEQLSQLSTQFQDAQEELRLAKASGDDDEVAKVRKELISLDKKLQAERRELEKERGVMAKQKTVQELAAKYGVPAEALMDSDNPYATALELYAAKSGSTNGSSATTAATYDSGTPTGKPSPKEMSPKDFNEYWDSQKRAAYAKR